MATSPQQQRTKEWLWLAVVCLAVMCVERSAAQRCVMYCDGASTCVTRDMLCDHFPDCDDLADEESCTSECTGFSCRNGAGCIDLAKKCDGHADCDDRSDEVSCARDDYRKTHPQLPETDLCLKPCEDGQCIFNEINVASCVCNGDMIGEFCHTNRLHEQLKNNMAAIKPKDHHNNHNHNNEVEVTKDKVKAHDESSKVALKFSCGGGDSVALNQLPWPQVCDGHFDCPDRTDEINCTRQDYQRSQQHLAGLQDNDEKLCLMRCERGSCVFAPVTGVAHCECPRHFGGVFCEQKYNDDREHEDSQNHHHHHEQNQQQDDQQEVVRAADNSSAQPKPTITTAVTHHQQQVDANQEHQSSSANQHVEEKEDKTEEDHTRLNQVQHQNGDRHNHQHQQGHLDDESAQGTSQTTKKPADDGRDHDNIVNHHHSNEGEDAQEDSGNNKPQHVDTTVKAAAGGDTTDRQARPEQDPHELPSQGSGFVSVVVIPLLVVGSAGFALWFIMTKHWKSQRGHQLV